MAFSWNNLTKPILGLAPMDGITDFPFRQIHATKGKPDVMFTEFTHVEGIWHGRPQVLENFLYHYAQRPIIAQIYGNKPDYFYKAAIMVCAMGFDGIDINMGCPAKNVTHSGGGAALIGTPDLAKEIIKSVKKAVIDWHNGITLEDIAVPTEKIEYIKHIHAFAHQPVEQLTQKEKQNSELTASRALIPVSVKTRIGIEQPQTEEWISHLLTTEPANITLHGRTLKQMYTGTANYTEIAKAASLVKQTNTTFLLNGDVTDKQDAIQKIALYGTDGALIGRAAMGNPWLWSQDSQLYTPAQRLQDAREHATLHAHIKDPKLFIQMRKHFGFYIKEFPYANEIKVKLIRTETLAEASDIINEALKKLHDYSVQPS